MAHIEAGWPDGTELDPGTPAGQRANEAMLSWLVRGTHRIAIDQRRRFGRHGQSRRLLAADRVKSHETWQDLVAALQRQAVHSALAQLRKADRQILTLAYLQGHTNREIAAMLGVSIRTVSRRLSGALARLDDHVRQAKIWVTSLVVLGLAHLRGARWPGGMPSLTAATAGAVAIGLVAVGPEPQEARVSTPPPAVTQSIAAMPKPPLITLPVHTATVLVSPATETSADSAEKADHGKKRGWRGHNPHAG